MNYGLYPYSVWLNKQIKTDFYGILTRLNSAKDDRCYSDYSRIYFIWFELAKRKTNLNPA